jgi:hypothetical protein
LSGAEIPYVRADWFVSEASVPPLYHDLLGLPSSVSQLEGLLGVDSARAISEEKNVVRAGIRNSGVSQNNRALERQPSAYGAYWKSYDFSSSRGSENVFTNPLSLPATGSEIIFSLPNGLQGYFVANSLGRRLDSAPVVIVSDRTNVDDPVVRTGRSCISCHYNGIKPFVDETAPVIRNGAGFVTAKTAALYPGQAVIEPLVRGDQSRFREALRYSGLDEAASFQEEPVNQFARRFKSDLSLEAASAELGIEPERFRLS